MPILSPILLLCRPNTPAVLGWSERRGSGREEGERVGLVESFLQVGVLLGDGLLEDGLLELKICRQSASPGESEL